MLARVFAFCIFNTLPPFIDSRRCVLPLRSAVRGRVGALRLVTVSSCGDRCRDAHRESWFGRTYLRRQVCAYRERHELSCRRYRGIQFVVKRIGPAAPALDKGFVIIGNINFSICEKTTELSHPFPHMRVFEARHGLAGGLGGFYKTFASFLRNRHCWRRRARPQQDQRQDHHWDGRGCRNARRS